jgi:hypothetical protein
MQALEPSDGDPSMEPSDRARVLGENPWLVERPCPRPRCQLCGLFDFPDGSKHALHFDPGKRHHAAHGVINRRVRAGWVPCRSAFLYAARALGKHVEEEGHYDALDQLRQLVHPPIHWLRVEDAEDVLEQLRTDPEVKLPPPPKYSKRNDVRVRAVRHVTRVLDAAAQCRAGTEWWVAWRLSHYPVQNRRSVHRGAWKIEPDGRPTP